MVQKFHIIRIDFLLKLVFHMEASDAICGF